MFNPSSKVYDYTFVELKPNGENEVSIVIRFLCILLIDFMITVTE